MGLAWFRKPTVSVEVLGAEIIVRMPGTRCHRRLMRRSPLLKSRSLIDL